ncbi:TIGR04086 family membrane protein [Desulfofalx alkaliphila]|uniref:TIGR04086 family membrane protein n=1 Tax=Desulfofalx alkaliphila TaxID=105483 RepID=UPI0004E11103|nr:TIGR04086 family membrane protein [Desulfofalx alkaliphila]
MFKGLTLLTWSTPTAKNNKNFFPGAVLTGLATAVGTGVAAVIALSVYVLLSTAPGHHLSLVITLITFGSALLGGIVCGMLANKHGLVHGGVVGGVYGFLYVAMNVYWGVFAVEAALLQKILPLLALGSLGGVVGVNLPGKKKPRRTIKIRLGEPS